MYTECKDSRPVAVAVVLFFFSPSHDRDLHKVMKAQHHYTCFVHKGAEISKKTVKRSTLGFKEGLSSSILYSHLIYFHYFADNNV
jgi:hypothetical protein